MRYERKWLDKSTRGGLKGSFVKLSDGVVHYEWQGPEHGAIVILVHGLTAPYFVWDHTIPFLAEKGFRVLRYDLYGRGYSDRPEIRYSEDLFDRQLLELFDVFKIEKAHLVGLSMGGLISSIFASRHSEKIQSINLIAPAGLKIPKPWITYLLKIPMLNQFIMKFVGYPLLISTLRNCFYLPEKFDDYQEKFVQQTKYKGYIQAILSTLLYMPLTDSEEIFREIAKKKIPTRLFWGKEDKIVPYFLSKKALEILPKADFYEKEEAGHLLQYEYPEWFNEILLSSLSPKNLS